MVLMASAVLIAAVATPAAVVIARHARQSPSVQLARPPGIPASIPADLANLMSLSPVPRAPAPGSALTGQDGQAMAMS
jgi:hypothetical protein